jgi:hypothetical protein
MQAVTDYTTEAFPPPVGSRYLAPDVNRIDIVLGYYYQPYVSGTPTNVLYINDARLTFNAGNTFSFEGIRNLGY